MNDRKEMAHPNLNEKADVYPLRGAGWGGISFDRILAPFDEFARREPIRLPTKKDV